MPRHHHNAAPKLPREPSIERSKRNSRFIGCSPGETRSYVLLERPASATVPDSDHRRLRTRHDSPIRSRRRSLSGLLPAAPLRTMGAGPGHTSHLANWRTRKRRVRPVDVVDGAIKTTRDVADGVARHVV